VDRVRRDPAVPADPQLLAPQLEAVEIAEQRAVAGRVTAAAVRVRIGVRGGGDDPRAVVRQRRGPIAPEHGGLLLVAGKPGPAVVPDAPPTEGPGPVETARERREQDVAAEARVAPRTVVLDTDVVDVPARKGEAAVLAHVEGGALGGDRG